MTLTRLFSKSNAVASSQQEKLCQRIEKLVSTERDLADRVVILEAETVQRFQVSGEGDMTPTQFLRTPQHESQSALAARDKRLPQEDQVIGGRPSQSSGLDVILFRTQVYGRAHARLQEDISLDSGSFRSSRLSILSKASFSDVSVMSFVALPIRISDLQSRGYYQSVPDPDLDPRESRASAGVEPSTFSVSSSPEPEKNAEDQVEYTLERNKGYVSTETQSSIQPSKIDSRGQQEGPKLTHDWPPRLQLQPHGAVTTNQAREHKDEFPWIDADNDLETKTIGPRSDRNSIVDLHLIVSDLDYYASGLRGSEERDEEEAEWSWDEVESDNEWPLPPSSGGASFGQVQIIRGGAIRKHDRQGLGKLRKT